MNIFLKLRNQKGAVITATALVGLTVMLGGLFAANPTMDDLGNYTQRIDEFGDGECKLDANKAAVAYQTAYFGGSLPHGGENNINMDNGILLGVAGLADEPDIKEQGPKSILTGDEKILEGAIEGALHTIKNEYGNKDYSYTITLKDSNLEEDKQQKIVIDLRPFLKREAAGEVGNDDDGEEELVVIDLQGKIEEEEIKKGIFDSVMDEIKSVIWPKKNPKKITIMLAPSEEELLEKQTEIIEHEEQLDITFIELDTKRNEDIYQKLQNFGLPVDDLMIDIAKRVEDVASENSAVDIAGIFSDTIDEIIYESLLPEMIDDFDSGFPVENSLDVYDDIRRMLNNFGILGDQQIIDLDLQMEKTIQDIEILMGLESSYYKYSELGFVFVDAEDFEILNSDLEDKFWDLAEIEELYETASLPGTTDDETYLEDEIPEYEDEDTGADIYEDEEEIEDTEITQEEVTEETETGSEQEEELIVEEESKGSITLKGYIAGGKGTISMTINLDTGNISGSFTYRDKAGECNVRVSAGIYGRMNLDTRKITTSVSGTSYYSGQEDYCNTTMTFTDSLGGRLSESYSSASGTCAHGESWYVE